MFLTSTQLDPTPHVHLCQRCPLWKSRRNVVRGEGPTRYPKLMVVGEAPGKDEDASGRPFVGKSGRLLRETLRAKGIDPASAYITNSCKCRPTNNGRPDGANRKPKAIEIKTCADSWLHDEIAIVQPELILAVGETAIRALWGSGKYALYRREGTEVDKKGRIKPGKPLTLTEMRRRDDLTYADVAFDPDQTEIPVQPETREIPVVVAYHPAAALRSPGMATGFTRDIERAAERMGIWAKADQSHDYKEVETAAEMEDLRLEFEALPPGKRLLALDTEYEDDGELVCASFSFKEGQGRVIVIPNDGWNINDAHKVFDLFEMIDDADLIVMQSAQADAPHFERLLNKNGTNPPWKFPYEKLRDTAIESYVLTKAPIGLKPRAEADLGLTVIQLDFDGMRKKGLKLRDLPREELVVYSAQDSDITLRLHYVNTEELDAAA